ncbi:F-type H+-transporting ATPase subunit b [Stella humosa]|uniref:ATP synthase subunit b n=1 Tax=Stella humosa TaxID=94 RepID=A0A3N1LIX0_9PROT|nr:F0F1 ATP synthase subunit B' [Stella humosa]ROP91094.1 F-type H+-transporting ATPase subunit b [Stella humosa]BBK34555.1 ATP synthase subunit b 2 [Stella humosa]
MFGRFLAAGLVLVPALAATAAMAAEGQSGAGLPQLDATKFAPQLIWLAITFGALYFLMSRVALPRVSEVLETRADHINDDLRRAEEARTEAEAVMQAYERALVDARSKAREQAKAATDAMTALAEARDREANQVLQGEAAAADARIAEAKAAAMGNVRQVATEVAVAAIKRIGGFDVDPARAAAAVDAVAGGRA